MINATDLLRDPAILELMPTAVYVVDTEGLIRGFNRLACEFWGKTPKLLDPDHSFYGSFKLHLPDGTFMPKEATPMVEAVKNGGVCKNAEIVILRPDGTQRTAMVNISPLRDEAGHIIGAINSFQDISEVVAARLKIEFQKLELERRDSFLSICSHELKTPLTVLMSQTQLAQRKIARNDESVFAPERVKSMLAQNFRQYDRLNRLVDDMLDLHRIKSGSLTMAFERLELVELVNEVVQGNAYGTGEVKGRVTVHAGGAVYGNFDRRRIEQVVINLVSNAIKYSASGPIEVTVSGTGATARIEVIDSGTGIAQKDHVRIFERFERAGSETKVSGLGVGLFVTKQIIEAHRGRIHLESSLGRGSKFMVDLPVSLPLKSGTDLQAAPK